MKQLNFNKGKSIMMLILLTGLFACAQNDLGDVIIKEDPNLPPFTKVNIKSLGNYELRVGNDRSIRIETHEEIINNIKYDVIDDELVISYKSFRRNQNIRKLEITISSETYEKITLNEVAEIDVVDPVNTVNLELNQNDVGNIRLAEVNVENLLINQEDVGDVRINNGTATNGLLNQNGVGNIKTFGVVYQNCRATVNDVGNIEVTVTDQLEATIRGVGNILYKGSPEVSESVSGTGSVKQR